MADKDGKRREVLLKWALEQGLIICNKEALYRLVRIVNEVGLGVEASVDDKGEVYFKHVPEFDYQEMVGLKLIIHADPKFRKKSEKESEDTNEENRDNEDSK